MGKKFIDKILAYIKFYRHIKKKFDYINKNNYSNFFLIELFDYYPSIISFSHYAEVISKEFRAKPILYNPKLPKNNLKFFLSSIKIYLNPIFYLYKTFGIEKFYNLKSNNYYKKKALKFYNINIENKNKFQLLDLKINNIFIGDLLYDEYLRSFNKSTLKMDNENSKEFKKYAINFIEGFYFWENFIEKNSNQMKALIISHTVYATGIAPRIAINKNIKVFCVGNQVSTLINKDNPYKFDDCKHFKKTFLEIDPLKKKEYINIGKRAISNRLSGSDDKKLLLDEPSDTKIYNTKIKKDVFDKNGKKRILVATHCFTDAVHFYGKFLFPDFYEWIDYLGKLSNELDYDWYIKFHPTQFQNNQKHFEYFKKKYKKFNILPQNTSNNDILREKVDAVLTVYGSIGHEFPLFGIPVINASEIGPHQNYTFNYYPKTIEEYTKLIKRIGELKNDPKKIENEIYEFVFMRYESNFEILENFQEIMEDLKTDYSTPLLYKSYLDNYKKSKSDDINNKILNFIKSNKIKHYKFDNKN